MSKYRVAWIRSKGTYGPNEPCSIRISKDNKIQFWGDDIQEYIAREYTFAELTPYWDLTHLKQPIPTQPDDDCGESTYSPEREWACSEIDYKLFSNPDRWAENCDSPTQTGNPGPVTLPHFDSCGH